MEVFVYKEKEPDRDCVCYFRDLTLGRKGVCGPCFAHGFAASQYNEDMILPYEDVDTALSKYQYYYLVHYGLDDEIATFLESSEAREFADVIRAEEFAAIMDEHGLSGEDVLAALDARTDGFWDRGCVAGVYANTTEAADEYGWRLDRHFEPNDIFGFEDFVVLDDGRVIELY